MAAFLELPRKEKTADRDAKIKKITLSNCNLLHIISHPHFLVIVPYFKPWSSPNTFRKDEARTEWLAQHQLKVIRFTNDEVLNDIDQGLAEIAAVCEAQG